MMRFTIDTVCCFDGELEEDVQVTFDYIKGFMGDMTDPPHGDEIDIVGARRNACPTEDLDNPEWVCVAENERIIDECLAHAREEIIDAKEAAAEARRDALEDR